MPEGTHPLLFFGAPTLRLAAKGHGRTPKVELPSHKRQVARVGPQFSELVAAFEQEAAEVRASPGGVEPEHVLVLELAGTLADFTHAAASIVGLEWLAEHLLDEADPDEDFRRASHREGPIPGVVFLVMTNYAALRELESLWRRYKTSETAAFPHPQKKFRSLFKHLRTIRRWGVADRIRETGLLEAWEEQINPETTRVRGEVEFFYRRDPARRDFAESEIRRLVGEVGGSLLSTAHIPEIAYHAALVELPVAEVRRVLASPETALLRCTNIMFVRPTGQAIVPGRDTGAQPSAPVGDRALPTQATPCLALLDGAPLAGHRLLADRLVVDDPEDWGAEYSARERQHGTALASLIVHGELDASSPALDRPVYIRPIMRPDHRDPRSVRDEHVPDDVLPVDLVHRAVRRMVEGEGRVPAQASAVRIVTLAVCDPAATFAYGMSAWARLLDWLALRYGLLFVVAAGNHPRTLVVSAPSGDVAGLRPEARQAAVLRALAENSRLTRLLAPAEAINAVTVGAGHSDSAPGPIPAALVDPLVERSLSSPVSAQGLGFRREIKPTILLPGGRQLYQQRRTGPNQAELEPAPSARPPGQRVAAPGTTAGDLAATIYTRGTSNSAALGGRLAAQLHDEVLRLLAAEGRPQLEPVEMAALLKSLLVHTASLGRAQAAIGAALKGQVAADAVRAYTSRYVGYGALRPERAMSCATERATVIGFGSVGPGEARVFELPVPDVLSGVHQRRTLTVTLAWITPTTTRDRRYRQAALWFTPPAPKFAPNRVEADGRAVIRGTVQHEVFVGTAAHSFPGGRSMRIQVNCREDASGLTVPAPFGLVVTLETEEGVGIPIYQPIRAALRVPVALRPGRS